MDDFRKVSGIDRAPDRTPDRAMAAPQPHVLRVGGGVSLLRVRLLGLVAGVVLPLLILTALIVYQSYQTARTDAGQRVLQTTRTTMAIVERELQIQIAALQTLADSPTLLAGDMEGFRQEAEQFLQRYSPASALSVSDGAGQLLLHTAVPSTSPLPRRANLDVVSRVFATAKPAISDMYISSVLQRPDLTIDVPVLRDGEVIYDLALSAPRSVFFDILARLKLPAQWVVSIADGNGHHIAREPVLSLTEITSVSDSLRAVLNTGADDGIVETLSVEGRPLFSAFSRSAEYKWSVAIGMPRETVGGPARRAFFVAMGGGGLLLLIGLWFAANMATHVMRADRQRDLLIHELNHRVKNTLASVQAIVSRGLKGVAPPAATQAIEARIMALSHAHNILSSRNWESAELLTLAQAVLAPYAGQGARRLTLTGPDVTLNPRVAVPLAMVLNELVTNAVKYGALSVPAGRVSLTWTQITPHRLRLQWEESGGPVVQPPAREGFGRKFLALAVQSELRGTYSPSFEPAGLRATLEIEV